MKNAICSLIVLFIFSACNEQGKNSTGSENSDSISTFIEDSVEQENNGVRNPFQKEQDNAKAVEESEETTGITQNNFSGSYKKVQSDGENNGTACNCDCLDLAFNSNFELCLIPDKMYITAICKKTGDGTADIFLVSPAKIQNLEQELPWEDFDRNTPIATVNMQPNGSLEMDWIGFSTNGELAVDYAIFGKKAVEGTYRKE